jgi:hypothetical protein
MKALIDVPENRSQQQLRFVGLSYTSTKPRQWGDDNDKDCTEKDQPDNKAFP